LGVVEEPADIPLVRHIREDVSRVRTHKGVEERLRLGPRLFTVLRLLLRLEPLPLEFLLLPHLLQLRPVRAVDLLVLLPRPHNQRGQSCQLL
jgi:hypothetical protein